MKPPLLAELLRDPAAIAERAVKLKQLLPQTNVSAMASKQPELLLQVTPAVLHALPALRWLLCWLLCCMLCLLRGCCCVSSTGFASQTSICCSINKHVAGEMVLHLMRRQTVTCAPQTHVPKPG